MRADFATSQNEIPRGFLTHGRLAAGSGTGPCGVEVGGTAKGTDSISCREKSLRNLLASTVSSGTDGLGSMVPYYTYSMLTGCSPAVHQERRFFPSLDLAEILPQTLKGTVRVPTLRCITVLTVLSAAFSGFLRTFQRSFPVGRVPDRGNLGQMSAAPDSSMSTNERSTLSFLAGNGFQERRNRD